MQKPLIMAAVRACVMLCWLLVPAPLLQAQEWWSQEPMPTARYGIAAVVWRDQIVVIGGRDSLGHSLRTVERYEPANNRWSRFPAELQEERFNAAATVYRGRILVIGGSRDELALRSVEQFNEQSNRWEVLNQLRVARDGPAAAIINDTLFTIGGFGADGIYLKSVEYYKPTLNEWDEGRWQLTFPRASLSALTVGDSIYTFGGLFHGPVGILERYHPSDGELRRADMITPRGSMAAAVHHNTLWAIGGSAQHGTTNTVEVYYPATDTWDAGPPLPTAREFHAAVVYGDNLYVIGGLAADKTVLASVEANIAVTAVTERRGLVPATLTLVSYPNPFQAAVQLVLHPALAVSPAWTVEIYTLSGARLRALPLQASVRGRVAIWDGCDAQGRPVPNGVYFAVVKMGPELVTRKLVKMQ